MLRAIGSIPKYEKLGCWCIPSLRQPGSITCSNEGVLVDIEGRTRVQLCMDYLNDDFKLNEVLYLEMNDGKTVAAKNAVSVGEGVNGQQFNMGGFPGNLSH